MNRSPILMLSFLVFGFAFLYVPILLLIIYSFNESRLVTVWAGFSVKWYGELLRNEQVLSAAWLSLRIAATNATIALALGTLAGLVMARFGRFRGRILFSGMIAAPLVMPEVITGLSLLLTFVALDQLVGWPGARGVTTITIAHRLNTVQRADEIMILDHGEIQEHGPRETLALDPTSRFFELLQTGLEEVLA